MNFIKNYLLYYYSFLYMLYKNCLTIEAADYKIKKILPFDKPRITAFLNNAFYPDDPELKAMNVTEIDEYHNDHIVGVIDQGYSYAAVGQDGNTAGVLLMGRGFINRFSTKDLTKIMEEYPVGYFRKLLKFYLATLEIGRTMNIPNHNHSMHITAAATLPKLRRQGIMRRLFQHGSETAKREGFKLVTCTTASQYIANLCESLKWSCISVLPLNALVDDQGKPIFHVDVPPHRFTRIYAQKLE